MDLIERKSKLGIKIGKSKLQINNVIHKPEKSSILR